MDPPVWAPVFLGEGDGVVADNQIQGSPVTLNARGEGYLHISNGITQSNRVGHPVQNDVFLHNTTQLIIMGIDGTPVESHQVVVVYDVPADLVSSSQMLDAQVSDIAQPVLACL